MNNDLTSVNNYLFEQLERLNDDEALQKKKNLTRKLKEQKQSHHYVRRLFLMLI